MSRDLPRASIVIPAHDEERNLGALLDVLTGAAEPGELEIVVVCNGCTDRTADIAARYDGVTVVEVPEPSKTGALNAGDGVATAFPRIYLDADVEITLASLRSVIAALRTGALAAAPLPVVDTAGCSWGARAYYEIFSRLGYVRRHVVGSGFYGLSEDGRRRFGAFPDLIADDGFVHSRFAHAERINPPGATFTIRAPRTLRSIYRRRIRIVAGLMQLRQHGTPLVAPPPSWRDVVRTRPGLAWAAAVYAGVNAAAAVQARRLMRSGGPTTWNRDETSRSPLPVTVRAPEASHSVAGGEHP
jgi:glycosyltransferase involved in cell wall biosynthesis